MDGNKDALYIKFVYKIYLKVAGDTGMIRRKCWS